MKKKYRERLKARYEELKAQDAKVSQEYLARKTGVSKSQINAVFSSKSHIGVEHLAKLCQALVLNKDQTIRMHYLYFSEVIEEESIRKYFLSVVQRYERYMEFYKEGEYVQIKDAAENNLKILTFLVEKMQKSLGNTTAVNIIRDNLLFPVPESQIAEALSQARELGGKAILGAQEDAVSSIQFHLENIKTMARWIEDHFAYYGPKNEEHIQMIQDVFAVSLSASASLEAEQILIRAGNEIMALEKRKESEPKNRVLFFMNTGFRANKKQPKKRNNSDS